VKSTELTELVLPNHFEQRHKRTSQFLSVEAQPLSRHHSIESPLEGRQASQRRSGGLPRGGHYALLACASQTSHRR